MCLLLGFLQFPWRQSCRSASLCGVWRWSGYRIVTPRDVDRSRIRSALIAVKALMNNCYFPRVFFFFRLPNGCKLGRKRPWSILVLFQHFPRGTEETHWKSSLLCLCFGGVVPCGRGMCCRRFGMLHQDDRNTAHFRMVPAPKSRIIINNESPWRLEINLNPFRNLSLDQESNRGFCKPEAWGVTCFQTFSPHENLSIHIYAA
jgi:hypothetical protein